MELKTILSIGGILITAGITWGLFNGQMVRANEKLTEHAEVLDQLKEEQQQDNVTQARLADRVEAIDEKVDKIDIKQAQMATEQTQMSRELFEQRTLLRTILEEVKKP